METHLSPDAVSSRTPMTRGSIPGFSPKTVRHTKLFSPTPPLFKLPSVTSRAAGITDSTQMISKSRGAILGALGPNKVQQSKCYITTSSMEKYGTQKLQRNSSCHKKPVSRNANSMNYTVNKIKKKKEYFAYEEEDNSNVENTTVNNDKSQTTNEIVDYLGTCQRLDSILADVSIPFKNGKKNKLSHTYDTMNNEERIGAQPQSVKEGIAAGTSKSKNIQRNTQYLPESQKPKLPLNTLKREILERKQRMMTYQNEIINSLESENSENGEDEEDGKDVRDESEIEQSNSSIGQLDDSFPIMQAQGCEEVATQNESWMNAMGNFDAQLGLKLSKKKKDPKAKFEMTTKCSIQTLLRPITAKDRRYQQHIKEDSEEKALASKPYVVKKISTKIEKSTPTAAAAATKLQSLKQEESNKCIIF